MMRKQREIDMLISEWKDEFDFGVWKATNCSSPGKPPAIVGGDGIDGFFVFATDGAVINCGEKFDTFEAAARFLETVFTWRIPAS
jgi:hypothetical protein